MVRNQRRRTQLHTQSGGMARHRGTSGPPPTPGCIPTPPPTLEEGRGGMYADGWNRNGTRMHTYRSQLLSMAAHRVISRSSVRVHPLGFLSSRITTMRVMRRRARGIWRV